MKQIKPKQGYMVLIIEQIRDMLKEGEAFSKMIYNGKVNPISAHGYYVTIRKDSNGEYQLSLKGR